MEQQPRFERLVRLLKSDPENVSLRRECLEESLRAKQYAVALRLADEGLALRPGDRQLQFQKSFALIGTRNFAAAIDELSALCAAEPGNDAARQNLALCRYVTGQYSQACGELQSLYRKGVRNADLVRLLVSSCHHLGDVESAARLADENAAVADVDGAVAGIFALVYLDAGRSRDAEHFAASALGKDPLCVDALTTSAALQLSAGDVETAQRAFESLAQLEPRSGRAWLGVGSAALLKQDRARAKDGLQRAVECMPQHIGSWHMLGWAQLLDGDLDAAQNAFDRAMEIDRNFAETHGALASVAAMRGQLDAARTAIKVAQRLNPDGLAAQFAESVIAIKLGKPDQAQQIIAAALTQFAATQSRSLTQLARTSRLH